MFKLTKELHRKYEPSFILSTDVKPSALEFAEDIVRRCVKLCEMEAVCDDKSDQLCVAYNNALTDAKNAILREFGLEKK